MQWLPAVALALGIAACGSGDDGGNMLAAPGNALSEAEIERALGPETAAAEPAVQPSGDTASATAGAADRPAEPASRAEDEEGEPVSADPPPEADEPAGEEQE